MLGNQITRRLKTTPARTGTDLSRCSCRPGTEGIRRCNCGRLCERLRAHSAEVDAKLRQEHRRAPLPLVGRGRGWGLIQSIGAAVAKQEPHPGSHRYAMLADPPQQKGVHARLRRAMGEGKAEFVACADSIAAECPLTGRTALRALRLLRPTVSARPYSGTPVCSASACSAPPISPLSAS